MIVRPMLARSSRSRTISCVLFAVVTTLTANSLAQIVPDAPTDPSLEPLFDEQFHLSNAGGGSSVIGADINVLEAWRFYGAFGDGVIVGILDDACDVNHEDLAANYTNLSQNAATGQRSQGAANPAGTGQRHGTSMMGLICAEANSLGVSGVAPRARFTVSSGADGTLSAAQIAGAFTFANERKVDVHCNTWAQGAAVGTVSSTVVNAINGVFEDGREGLGMVVVFPAGNDAVEAAEGSSLAAARNRDGQKLVIGVGASNARDRAASYSNFGAGVDVVAPSSDVFLPQIVTTDNTDGVGLGDEGYNSNGRDEFGQPNLPDPQYTRGDGFAPPEDANAFGTAAAAAQVAGVAALILSVSENNFAAPPTATQVRALIEHTADKIPLSNPDEGDYNTVTGRSSRYGYGRVNAGAAVAAASLMSNNSPFTWPERVKNVRVDTRNDTLSWEKNDDVRTIDGQTSGDATSEVLVVQRVGRDFDWAPADGETYFERQIVDSAQDVRVARNANVEEFDFDDARGVLYFGIFARNAAGRYSFGVSVNSLGTFVETGRINGGGGNTNNNDNDGTPGPEDPTISIRVSPLSGISPLEVSFRGNAAESSAPIVSASWDFGDGTPPVNQPVAVHTYTLTGTTTQSFEATFTVTDEEGHVGRRSVLITVFSSEDPGGGDPSGGSVRITVRLPGQSADIGDTAVTGERLELSVDTSRIVGTPQSILWSLGDGGSASSFVVLHTYSLVGTFPITAAVTSMLSSGDNVVFPASRLITITPAPTGNVNANGNDNAVAPPTSGSGDSALCGLGMMVPMLAMFGLAALRRLRFHSH